MTDKELRRLSRGELLEMLLAQTRENQRLREELERTQAELKNREILIAKSGTMAEASLRLNGMFEAADRAVSQYLENVRRIADEQLASLAVATAQNGKAPAKPPGGDFGAGVPPGRETSCRPGAAGTGSCRSASGRGRHS